MDILEGVPCSEIAKKNAYSADKFVTIYILHFQRNRMTTFVQYIYLHRQECNLFQFAWFFFFKLHSYLLRMCTFYRSYAQQRMNEEEERATLENFVDSSILELLLNEKEDEKDIVHKMNR